MFSMASMTDIIFLLLIFFMVTSTFVFPSALEVNLPQSSQQTALKPTTRIYIDKDLNMYSTQDDGKTQGVLTPLPIDQLEGFMTALKAANPDEFVAVYADELVPYGKIVDLLSKGAQAGVKIVLATKPASQNFAAPSPDEAQNDTQAPADAATPTEAI